MIVLKYDRSNFWKILADPNVTHPGQMYSREWRVSDVCRCGWFVATLGALRPSYGKQHCSLFPTYIQAHAHYDCHNAKILDYYEKPIPALYNCYYGCLFHFNIMIFVTENPLTARLHLLWGRLESVVVLNLVCCAPLELGQNVFFIEARVLTSFLFMHDINQLFPSPECCWNVGLDYFSLSLLSPRCFRSAFLRAFTFPTRKHHGCFRSNKSPVKRT